MANPMQQLYLDKVVINIGIGDSEGYACIEGVPAGVGLGYIRVGLPAYA